MFDTLFFSVVIPLYNKEDYIENTIKSVLAQSYQNFEIIIVNDGCTDDSVTVVTNLKSDVISIIHQKNLGLSAARNSGIRASKHNYIAFLDADDLWCKDYLQTIKKLITLNPAESVYTSASAILRPWQIPNLNVKPFDVDQVISTSNYFTFKRNFFSNSSLVIKKEVFDTIGYYNEHVNYGEEEDFSIRCFSRYKLVHYNASKVYYLKGIENQLTAPNNKIERKIPDYSKYLTKENYKTLKPYIDFVHFKLIVLYKMERNKKLVKIFKDKVELSNLTFIQKIKFFTPSYMFYYLKSLYIILLRGSVN